MVRYQQTFRKRLRCDEHTIGIILVFVVAGEKVSGCRAPAHPAIDYRNIHRNGAAHSIG